MKSTKNLDPITILLVSGVVLKKLFLNKLMILSYPVCNPIQAPSIKITAQHTKNSTKMT